MRVSPYLFAAALAMASAGSFAQSMECERYRVEGNLKTERSLHRITLDASKSWIDYAQTSGKRWVAPARGRLPVTWRTPDGLRIVATLASDSANLEKLESPVHVFDIDLSRPRVRVESFGGVTDFDEVIEDPWRWECRRLN
jgi:hypothetical protein